MDFARIWSAYPTDYYPCRLDNDDPAFDNQCAIRFGLSLLDGGVDMSGFPGVRCWHGHRGKHLLRGEEISAYMESKPRQFGRVEKFRGVDQSKFFGRRGFIFCRNFWGTGNQGDHIDLWNLNHMATGDPSYIVRSEEVWFWTLENTAFKDTEQPRKEGVRKRTGDDKSAK